MVENKISKLTKERDKPAKGQTSFRLKHSIVDHCITLRHIIRKAFDSVPRDNLWHRMGELGVPKHLRATVHRLYEEVRVNIRTSAGISESF